MKTLDASYNHHSNPLPLQEQQFRILSLQRPSFCPLPGPGPGQGPGRNDVILNPYSKTGYTCFDNENSNNNTVKDNIIGYENSGFVEADCSNVNGKWEVFNCSDAEAFYRHEADTSDLEMLASWWSPTCCSTKEEIQQYWYEEKRERRELSRTNVIIEGVMGWISTIASSIFIWMLRRSHDGFSTTQNRVLLCLCMSDIIYSFQFLTFGMMAHKALDYTAWNARGNMATCQVEGFLIVLGSAGPGYTASLCCLYLAIVKYDKSDKYIRAKFEPFFLGVPVLVVLGYYVFRLATGTLRPGDGGSCTSLVYNPPHCQDMEDGFVIEGLFGDIPCDSEISKTVKVVGFGYLFLWVSPLFVMITCLVIIYREVLFLEKDMSKYGARPILEKKATGVTPLSTITDNEEASATSGIWGKCSSLLMKVRSAIISNVKRKKRSKLSGSRMVLYRGFAYSCSWLLTWGPAFIGIFIFLVREEIPISIRYLVVLFMPFQGFFNLAIFMLPKILVAKRSKRENLALWQAVVKAFWSKGRKSKKKGRNRVPMVSSSRHSADEENKQKTSETDQKHGNQIPKDVTYLSFGRCVNRHGNDVLPPVPLHTTANQDSSLNKKDEVVVVGDDHFISDANAMKNGHIATRRSSARSLLSCRSSIEDESSHVGISYATEDGHESC